MDWRLIAAVAAAAGSLCIVAVGSRVVLTTSPPQRQTVAAAPALTSEYRFPIATTPPSARVQPPSLTPASPSLASPSLASPSLASTNAFAAGATSSSSVFAPEAAVAPGRVDASPPFVFPPPVTEESLPGRPGPRAGYKTAAVKPNDVFPPEPPARPLVEAKRPSVVPELHTALPTSHYHGVLTPAEISRIKHNLRLTSEQEPTWPRVEAALAEMGRQQIALIRQGQEPRISPNDWPPSRLYAVAGPLLQTLRPDQKETVRKLCRSLGFESVASLL